MRKLLLGLIGLLFAVPSWATDLPAGYTELQYIESTGTQYIDTGIKPDTDYDVETVFTTPSTLGNGALFGNQSSDVLLYLSSNNFMVYNNNSNKGNLTPTVSASTKYSTKLSVVGTSATISGDLTGTFSGLTITGTRNILLGANYSSNVTDFGKFKYNSVKITKGGVLVRNLIPAKRNSDNVIGMYDTVSGTFFTNAGSGTFTGGPAVLDSCRNLFDSTPYKTGYYINESGVEQSANVEQYIIRQAVVQPGTQYTLSFVVTQASYTQRYHAYDANGNWLSQVAAVGGSEVVGTKVIKTFTTPANTKYIRQGGRSQSEYQLELGSTATEYVPYCANAIKIATTAYNSARFSPVVTELNTTIATIRDVVTNTINQTAAIADLQATKQTRPNENCPAGKKCLLVEDDAGQPHWYEIIENAYGLPNGYTALEYIQSSGTQYIDTGFIPNENDKLAVEFDMYSIRVKGAHICGMTDGEWPGKGWQFGIAGSSGSASWNQRVVDNVVFGSTMGMSINTWYHVKADDAGYYVNGVLKRPISSTASRTTSMRNFYVFRANTNNSSTYNDFNGRIGVFDLYQNNNLIRKLIPARRNSDNTIGMYDTVNGTFYTNAGTGTFTAGPAVQ